MLLCKISQHSLRRRDVIRRRENNLHTAQACRNRNHVKQFQSLVRINREVLLSPKHSHAATNVPGKRLNLLERNHLRLARPGSGREFLEIQLRIARNDCKNMLLIARNAEKRLKNLLRRQPNLLSHQNRREILGIQLIFAQLIANTKRVEITRSIRLHTLTTPFSTTALTLPTVSAISESASGSASSRWCVVSTMVRPSALIPASRSSIWCALP